MSTTPADYRIIEAEPRFLPQILSVQHEAFGRVAQMLSIDPAVLPPLRETALDLEVLSATGTRFWAALDASDDVVGSVRARMDAGVVEVGRLVVSSAHLRNGVASALMGALEAGFPNAVRYELFTGADAAVPLALYARLGYRVTRDDASGPVHLVWLAKDGPAHEQSGDAK